MPWPMIHLKIADLIHYGDCPSAFLLGSIAPDAVHVKPGSARHDKNRTHWYGAEGSFPTLDRIRDHYLELARPLTDPARKAFLQGYAAHIITDIRWRETVYAGFLADMEQSWYYRLYSLFRPVKAVYTKDIRRLEYELADWELLEKLAVCPSYGLPPYIQPAESGIWRDRTMAFFHEDPPEGRLATLSKDRVLSFIDDTAEEIRWLLSEWDMQSAETGSLPATVS